VIAQNWERPGAPDSAESIDFADGAGGVTVNFDDVVVQPGKTVGFMSVVTLALDIKAARKAAARAASHPADAGVFRGLTKREKKRLVNW
jgi:hypothetical protein